MSTEDVAEMRGAKLLAELLAAQDTIPCPPPCPDGDDGKNSLREAQS